MKNFKGLHKYAQGGINTESFAPGNAANNSMMNMNSSESMSNFGDGGKSSKKARRYNKKHAAKLNCYKPNH